MNPVTMDVKTTVKDKCKVLLRATPGYPDLNLEVGNISGFTENLVLLMVHIQFCPFVLYVFISVLLSILFFFFVILKFRLCSLCSHILPLNF